MKRRLLIFAVLSIAMGLGYYIKSQRLKSKKAPMTTFEKKRNNMVTARPTTSDERKKLKRPIKKSKRLPSSGRKILGGHKSQIQSFSNKVSEDWKNLLGVELLKHQKKGTKVFVENEDSFIQVKKKNAQYIEKVLITYQRLDGSQSSFHAFVDSETGEVLKTWNRSIQEPIGKSPLKLSPSGSL